MKAVIKRSIVLTIALFLANFIYGAHVIVPQGTCYLVGTSTPYSTLHGGDTLLMTSGNKAYICMINFTGSSTAP